MLIHNYAVERYGNESPENIRRAMGDFNHYLTQQGSQGVNNMHDIINGFVSGKGYGWGNTTSTVHGAMDETRTKLQGSGRFKQDVGMSAMEAGAETFGVNEDSFSMPTSNVPLDNPNAKAVTDPADTIRDRHRMEELGNGGIHTTAGGIVREMAGLNAYQPISPTSELYRNDAFYNEGRLPEQREGRTIVLPSGMVLRGTASVEPSEDDKTFFKGSVFEKK